MLLDVLITRLSRKNQILNRSTLRRPKRNCTVGLLRNSNHHHRHQSAYGCPLLGQTSFSSLYFILSCATFIRLLAIRLTSSFHIVDGLPLFIPYVGPHPIIILIYLPYVNVAMYPIDVIIRTSLNRATAYLRSLYPHMPLAFQATRALVATRSLSALESNSRFQMPKRKRVVDQTRLINVQRKANLQPSDPMNTKLNSLPLSI